MTRGIYTIASGGVAALARLDAATQNLANVNTAGYKGDRIAFALKPLTAGPRATVDPVLGRTAAQIVEASDVRDFSQGPVRTTGNALDVAIQGDGFFVAQTAHGPRYTRQGTFQRDGEGYLVTGGGERVQGDSGDIRLGTGEVAIGEDGSVNVDGASVGTLKVVSFGDNPALVPEGSGLFAAAPGAVPKPLDPGQATLVPGAVEGANVDAVRGMIELVDVSRAFESYMHAMSRLDEITQRSINDVGRVG